MDPAQVAAPNSSVVARAPDPSIMLKHPNPQQARAAGLADRIMQYKNSAQGILKGVSLTAPLSKYPGADGPVFSPRKPSLFDALKHPTYRG